MKGKFFKVVCTVICALMACSSFVGCTKKEGDNFINSPSSIQIGIQNAGYGYKWLKEAMKLYTQETGVTFAEPKVYSTYGQTTKSALNYVNNDTDLYFDIQENPNFYSNLHKAQGLSGGRSGTFYVDISDVYESKAEGYGDDNLKIKDLVTDITYQNYTWTDNKQYAFSWARGVEGLIYNRDYFKDNNCEVPKTTDELLALCEKIKNLNLTNAYRKKVYAVNWSDGYWGQCSLVWTFQYEGMDVYNNYQQGKNAEGKYSSDIYKMKGKEYAYEVINKIVDHDMGYSSTACSGYSFTQNQVKFLEGESFMMPNGDWLEREMKANFDGEPIDFAMMKMPVNSKIIEKLSTVNTDAELSEIISYVDGEIATIDEKYSTEDIEYVRQARNMLFTQQLVHCAYIPFYSDKIAEAKDFIRFLYRKDVQMLMAKNSYGNMFPTKYDFSKEDGYDKLSNMKKSCDSFFTDATLLANLGKYPIYYIGGCAHYWNGQTDMSLDHGSGSYKTAAGVIQNSYEFYGQDFDNWMRMAGVSND